MKILVYSDWDDIFSQAPKFIGTLSASYTRGKEIFSFEYSQNWLDQNISTILDPDLQFFKSLNT